MKTTKKQVGEAKTKQNELREHYDFDYNKASPNRFAERLNKETTLVVLDPDVATIFPTSEAVNDALRVLIAVAGKVITTQQPPTPDINQRSASAVALSSS